MILPSCTILIVDDSSAAQELYQRYLLNHSSGNYQFLLAESVAVGLELYATQVIDAVLLSHAPPQVDGLVFLEALSDRRQVGSSAIIMIGASSDTRLVVRAIKLGVEDYLVKQDLTPEQLQLTIQRAVEQRRSRLQWQPSDDRSRYVNNTSDDWDTDSALQTLQASEERLRVGIQVAGVALVKFDYVSNTVELSPQAAGMYGLPTTQLTVSRDRLHATFHPDERAELLATIEQIMDPASTGWFARDHRVVWPTGEVRWLSVRKQIFFDRSGKVARPSYAILAAIDITERKRIEAALQESERKFGAIFDQTFELMGILSLDGVVQEINQSALNSIAAQKGDIVGQVFWETPWWTHSQQLQDQLRDAIDRAIQGELIRYEVPFPSGSGALMVTDFSLKPVFDEVGQVVMVIAEGYDITERKQTEAALLESEERFRTLADNISQLAWMADTSGWVFWYNRRWFDYTGTTWAEMEGWGWQQVHHPDHLDRVVERFRCCIEAGEYWEDTFPLRGQDGTYHWFLSRAIPISDADGQVLRWFGTNTDVTDLKHTQAALEKQNKELDSFVYLVSHDLKAPLRAIANLSQWIEDDLVDASSEIQQQMTLLRSRIYRMEAMIDGLLQYARVGRADLEIEPVAVADLLLEVVDSVAPPAPFTVTIPHDLPTLYTKRLLLSQVLANLIGNGIKHHDRVDGAVQVSVIDQGDFYEFVIADDGPGIALQYQENIFTIFQTGNPHNRPDSTGIGLAIVKKIVEAEAGTIRLESHVGQGTTFYFTWPKQPQTDRP